MNHFSKFLNKKIKLMNNLLNFEQNSKIGEIRQDVCMPLHLAAEFHMAGPREGLGERE
jgi:hypothetical protein